MNRPQLAGSHRFSSTHVLVRFALRLVIFAVFAAVSTVGFRIMFPTLLTLSAIYCAIAAIFRGEAILGRVLTHWDEAAGCGALACLMAKLSMT